MKLIIVCMTVFLLAIDRVSMKMVNSPFGYVATYPVSCADIKKQHPNAVSGLYDIRIDQEIVTVYCEMALYGGGFTFIPRDAVRSGKLTGMIKQLFNNRAQVLLRFQNKNGLQPYTLISQLPGSKNKRLSLLLNTNSAFQAPRNAFMKEFLYLAINPTLALNGQIRGFLANGSPVTYKHCGTTPKTNSYFAFFPNHRELGIHPYHNSNLVYETKGVAVDWRKKGIPSSAHRQLPNEFMFLTEVHFGGCGTYTSSDRWRDAFGTAIGVR